MIEAQAFREQLIDAIEKNSIVLPTLPEVALKVRDAAEKDNTTAQDMADIIVTDPAISARLLQVANSPLYRPARPIENVKMAITRLGNKLVRSLVTSLAMKQIYQATSDYTEHKLRQVWEESVQVAAVSKVLSHALPQLEDEQAMLAGLIHNIGTLPILTLAEQLASTEQNPAEVDELINGLSPEIGGIILQKWDFPPLLSIVPTEYRSFYREIDAVDYADMVLVARLQLGLEQREIDWPAVSAFDRIGLDHEVNIVDIEENANEIEHVKSALAN